MRACTATCNQRRIFDTLESKYNDHGDVTKYLRWFRVNMTAAFRFIVRQLTPRRADDERGATRFTESVLTPIQIVYVAGDSVRWDFHTKPAGGSCLGSVVTQWRTQREQGGGRLERHF